MAADKTPHEVLVIDRIGSTAVVSIDNPPVNALNADVRAALLAAFLLLRSDSAISGIVLACKGRTFVAGADISEFGKPPKGPTLPEIIQAIEHVGKPTIAAIHGTALGGGLELALGCNYRLATPTARLGLPEVLLGLMPGAGGSIRLPYLAGPEEALSIIVSGHPVDAGKALALGIVDGLAENDLVSDAVAFLADKLERGITRPSLSQDRRKIDQVDMPSFDRLAGILTKRAGDLIAPAACVESVRNAMKLPFEAALQAERQAFEILRSSEQSKALRHLFFAERAATKVDGVDAQTPVRDIARIGIVGGGTMGTGIAMAFANAGLSVTILDINSSVLDKTKAKLDKTYSISVDRGSISEEQKRERLSLITTTAEYSTLADCDLVIEAAFENMELKKEIFSVLDKVVRQGAILASNTSYLDINEIALATSRPADVVGAHFFSPANVMKLLEIVRGTATGSDVLKTLISVAKRIGKVPVVVGVCRGFVGNRMLAARSAESINLLLEGASPQEVDKAFTDFGWPMGPFQMQDLAGLDISWQNRQSLSQTLPIADDLCEQGRFGQKTGKGYYTYEAGSRIPIPDNEVIDLIEAKARSLGIVRRPVDQSEIIERTLYPMINEGARLLSEGIASRSSDIDLVWVHGYGFPVSKGGPMFWAETQGYTKIIDVLQRWHEDTGRDVFKPSTYLLALGK